MSIDIAEFVSSRVLSLQNQVLSDHRAGATAQLAHLRQAVGSEPGSSPAIWGLTLDGLDPTARGDVPTRKEVAAHIALTLYAVHQQSKSRPMHVAGVGLGQAVSRLAGPAGSDGHAAVRRHFDAAATAIAIGELSHHLRGLVSRLRAEDIPLDYARLARNIWRFQQDGGPDAVRREWGRDFYRRKQTSAGTSSATSSAAIDSAIS